MSISPQAQTIIKALLAIGISRSDFAVRTERHRISWIDQATGTRQSALEYGAANGHLRSKEARQVAFAARQELADQHLTVTSIAYAGCGHPLMVMVSSDWNSSRSAEPNIREGSCHSCRSTSKAPGTV